MKKLSLLFSFLFVLLLSCLPANAQKTVGILFNAPDVIQKNAEQIDKLDARLVQLLPSNKYTVLPVKIMMDKETEFRKRKKIFQAPNQALPPALSNEALGELGKENGCDYIITINMQASEGKPGIIMIMGEKRIGLVTNMVIRDLSENRDICQKHYSNTGVDGGHAFAFNRKQKVDEGNLLSKAYDKFLKKIEIIPGTDIP